MRLPGQLSEWHGDWDHELCGGRKVQICNSSVQYEVHGIIPETCEVVDGGITECREIVIAGWLGADEARLL